MRCFVESKIATPKGAEANPTQIIEAAQQNARTSLIAIRKMLKEVEVQTGASRA